MPTESTSGLDTTQIHELKEFGARINKLGVNFAVCDARGRLILLSQGGGFESNPNQMAKSARDCLGRVSKDDSAPNLATPPTSRYLAASLLPPDAKNKAGFAALIDLGSPPDADTRRQAILFSEMLNLFAEKFAAQCSSSEQMDMIGAELAQTYEELVLLYKISTNMEIVEPDANFLQMACDSLTEIVSVEGIAILQERIVDEQTRFYLVAGAGVIDIDERMTMLLYNRLLDEMGKNKEALLDSEVDDPFRYEWPENIRNIIVVPLCGKEKSGSVRAPRIPSASRQGSAGRLIGMLVAINRLDKPDFDSTDVKLFNSVASACAVFVENNRLFNDLKELFIGSLKALTRSIDAKDRYTRGHSERVAFISKWIAEQLAQQGRLPHEQIPKIYLAGLLHDIGKIGIDEKVLCKTEKLTDSERKRVQTHPSIGANILSGIKQMRDIIPGVLYHHERIDGKGYPAGLKGDEIPLMGKIIGLADCFDAMTSDRVYHDALTVEDAIAEMEDRLNTHFDEHIGRIFIDSDVYHLWDLMEDGFMRTYGADDFSHYGSIAVGTLIK